MNKRQKILETGSYGQLITNLCLPTIVIVLVMVVYNMADTFFIGQTGDPSKIAALSLCAPVFTILSGLGTLLGNGGCTAISLALGRKDTENISKYTAFCAFGSLIIGITSLLLILFATEPVVLALGADADTVDFACTYLRILALGAPFIVFNQIFTNIIRSDGAAVASMICNGLGTISNIILDALFILVFSWDVAGAALATVIGNGLSCVYLIWYLMKKQPAFSIHPKHLCFRKDIVLPVLTLGLPLACSTLLMSFSHTIANRMMISYGSVMLAAQGVAGKIGMLLSMTAMGICMGLQPAVSYSFASRNKKRLAMLLRSTAVFTIITGSILSILCFVFRNSIMLAFIDNTEVITHGQIMVLAGICTGPFYGLYQLCQTFLQASGKASYATFVATLDKGLVYLPVLFVMERAFGAYGIAFSGAVTLILSLAVGFILSRKWYMSTLT